MSRNNVPMSAMDWADELAAGRLIPVEGGWAEKLAGGTGVGVGQLPGVTPSVGEKRGARSS